MSSELQQIASRTNGAKSNGPTTEEGKQASSQNGLAHSFNSKRIVLAGESQEEFDALLASCRDENEPETPTEHTLIETMAVGRWRQQRVRTLGAAGLANEMRRPRYIAGEDPETQTFVAFRTLTDDTRPLELLNLRAKRRTEERADATAPEDPQGKRRLKFHWVGEEGNKTLQADTYLDPDPVSSSFRTTENPPVTDGTTP